MNFLKENLKEPLSGLFYILGSISWMLALSFALKHLDQPLSHILLVIVILCAIFLRFWWKKIPTVILAVFYFAGVSLVIAEILLVINWQYNLDSQTIVLAFTLGAGLFYVGETRRIHLETNMSNRLSYLPGLILYFKRDGSLWLKNIGKGIALKPSFIKNENGRWVEEKPIEIPISNDENLSGINPQKEEEIKIESLKEIYGQLCDTEIKISFDCINESTSGLNQWTKERINTSGGKKEWRVTGISWSADYKRSE